MEEDDPVVEEEDWGSNLGVRDHLVTNGLVLTFHSGDESSQYHAPGTGFTGYLRWSKRLDSNASKNCL